MGPKKVKKRRGFVYVNPVSTVSTYEELSEDEYEESSCSESSNEEDGINTEKGSDENDDHDARDPDYSVEGHYGNYPRDVHTPGSCFACKVDSSVQRRRRKLGDEFSELHDDWDDPVSENKPTNAMYSPVHRVYFTEPGDGSERSKVSIK